MRRNRVYLARCGITIVAAVAVTDTAGIVRPGAADKGCGGVTGRTVEVGRDVGGYGIYHAFRRSTVMA